MNEKNTGMRRASAQGSKPGNLQAGTPGGLTWIGVVPGLSTWWEETVRSGDTKQKAGKGGAGAGADPAV